MVVHARLRRAGDYKMSDSVMYGQRLDEICELLRENQALKASLSLAKEPCAICDELIRQGIAREADISALRSALTEATAMQYNAFEPANQSAAWKRWAILLRTIPAAEKVK